VVWTRPCFWEMAYDLLSADSRRLCAAHLAQIFDGRWRQVPAVPAKLRVIKRGDLRARIDQVIVEFGASTCEIHRDEIQKLRPPAPLEMPPPTPAPSDPSLTPEEKLEQFLAGHRLPDGNSIKRFGGPDLKIDAFARIDRTDGVCPAHAKELHLARLRAGIDLGIDDFLGRFASRACLSLHDEAMRVLPTNRGQT